MSSSTKTTKNRVRRQRRTERLRLLKQEGKIRSIKNPSGKPKVGRKGRPSQPSSTPASNLGIRLSRCTEIYARSLVNPFGPLPLLPCIPDTVTLPSHKFVSKCRGVFSTGTANGIGWVLFDPFKQASNNNSVVGGQVDFPVIYTDNTYASAGITVVAAGGVFTTVGINGANGNSSFTIASLSTADRQIRLVSAGLSVRYIGTDFRNQGRVILYRNQGNYTGALNGSLTGSVLLQDNYAISVPVARKTEYVYYIPDSFAGLSYQLYTTMVAANPTLGGYSYIIYVDGGDTTTAQSWEFETVTYWELVGSNLTLTRSEADPVGMGATMSSLPTKAPSQPPPVEEQNFLMKIYDEVVSATSGLVMTGARNLPAYAGAAALSAMRVRSYRSGMSQPVIMDVE